MENEGLKKIIFKSRNGNDREIRRKKFKVDDFAQKD